MFSRHFKIEVFGGLVESVVIVNREFDAADLVFVPAVEAADLPDVGGYEEFVVVGEACFIDAGDAETAGTDVVLYEIGEEGVVGVQVKQVGEVFGEEYVGGSLAGVKSGECAFFEVVAEECPVVVGVNAFEEDALKVGVGFQYAQFCGEGFRPTDAGESAQAVQEGGTYGYGNGFVGRVAVEIGYLDVGAEADDFVAHFFFEAGEDGDGEYHYGKSQSDARHGDAYRGGDCTVTVFAFAETDSFCDEEFGGQWGTIDDE